MGEFEFENGENGFFANNRATYPLEFFLFFDFVDGDTVSDEDEHEFLW